MGFANIFKRSRDQTNRTNQEQGREGERKARAKYEMVGYEVTRTGKGHDFKATKRDPISGKKSTIYVEVKTGNSKLSPLQKKKQKQLSGRYKVERENTITELFRSKSSTRRSNGNAGRRGRSSSGTWSLGAKRKKSSFW